MRVKRTEYVSPAEYARLRGVSRQRVMALIAQGRLPCWRPVPWVYAIDRCEPWPASNTAGRPKNVRSMQDVDIVD